MQLQRAIVFSAGDQVAVPDSRITGLRAGAREALVYLWRAVPDARGVRRPASLRTLIVPLQ